MLQKHLNDKTKKNIDRPYDFHNFTGKSKMPKKAKPMLKKFNLFENRQ